MPSDKPLPTLQDVTQELLNVSQQCMELSLLLQDYQFELETRHAGNLALQSEDLLQKTLEAIESRIQSNQDNNK